MKYALVCVAVVGILALLKCVEGSPLRSWKSVFLLAAPLSFLVCYYISCAFPPPPLPQPRSAKVVLNKGELERTFRRIEGVDRASIDGPVIRLNFTQDKPLAEFKSIARRTGGTAAHFLKLNETNRVVVLISIGGRSRYALVYDTATGVVDETSF
jgi:hypothetical protein